MSPLFSVVIPTYNRAEKLMRAVQSLHGQTFGEYEILVIDDGADDTAQRLGSLAGKVNYIRGPGAGVAAGRNLGIERAQGAYVAFLDADDWWYPTKLQKVAQAIQASPDAGLFYSRLDYVNEAGKKLWTPKIRAVQGDGYQVLLESNFIANSAVVVKKECLARVGGFDAKLSGCEDWDLWIRVARTYPIWFVPEILVAYEYLSKESFSSRPAIWIKAHDEVIEKAFQADSNLTPAAQQRIRSSAACVKGRIALGARSDAMALVEFKRAVRLNWRNWRALIYAGVLAMPLLRRFLPRRIKRALRLPEATG